jgi:hypothetical protein
MTEAFTARNYQIARAPKRIELLGDKQKRPEPAQHIIEFPGGAIELSRTTDGNYWAHIIVNQDWSVEDMEGLRGALGDVVGSRIMRVGDDVRAIERDSGIQQIAVLIKPQFSKGLAQR